VPIAPISLPVAPVVATAALAQENAFKKGRNTRSKNLFT